MRMLFNSNGRSALSLLTYNMKIARGRWGPHAVARYSQFVWGWATISSVFSHTVTPKFGRSTTFGLFDDKPRDVWRSEWVNGYLAVMKIRVYRQQYQKSFKRYELRNHTKKYRFNVCRSNGLSPNIIRPLNILCYICLRFVCGCGYRHWW